MPRWKAGAVVVVLVLLTFGGGIDWLHDMLFYPWARATPPLLDEWVGGLTTGNGEPLTVAFMLARGTNSDGSNCENCPQIVGLAVTCDARGTARRYEIFGSPTDRAGHRLNLNMKPEPDPPPDGLEFSAVWGTWDGADALALQALFHWRRGVSATSATDDPATQPVPLRMSRKKTAAASPPCAR
jgi:hypothetical protein